MGWGACGWGCATRQGTLGNFRFGFLRDDDAHDDDDLEVCTLCILGILGIMLLFFLSFFFSSLNSLIPPRYYYETKGPYCKHHTKIQAACGSALSRRVSAMRPAVGTCYCRVYCLQHSTGLFQSLSVLHLIVLCNRYVIGP